ncbi:alkyl hydroperoxide reductase/ Thiol specific antioxidant/ Mal allergen [Denitrovibrio acetiphilus DSM 12809]|uniref:Alkyl hydroperoxide reductase/ Thiol specific antioxidant/ Mal allergen n=1 Tax=Denitrovibrio acetiphilus (strain DSM 12809 / NBRC 114555 / N2460) TaxID=522772 RepID=D4H6U2_DENA2|nr:TlpA disulfide reductase family protein [Denitrovibrio acetiphilus]ADD67808.1 alkyl hydroperoxide reductase/ Thiol specific antioxidant/ Mal allergen [Denitrovibrio acetiphilus DSM 12809]
MRLIALVFITLFAFSAFADDMPAVDLDGLLKEVRAHDAKTMVVFWAPWCPFCIRELKILRNNPQFATNNNLQIIGLTKRNDRRAAVNFVKKQKMPFRFFIAEQDVYDKLQRIDAVPLTVVFSKEGKVLDYEYGKQDIEDLALMLED